MPRSLQLLHRHPDLADPGPQHRVGVVRVGRGEELDAAGAQRVHARADVGRGERQVLHAGAAVELQVLVDLRLLLADGGLVERELHPVVAARHHLAHQRRVLGGDVVADELGHVGEAHDPVVEVDPLVHRAELDVADHVVERDERRRVRRGRRCRAPRTRAGRGRGSGSGRPACARCRRRRRSPRSARCRARRSRRAARRRSAPRPRGRARRTCPRRAPRAPRR